MNVKSYNSELYAEYINFLNLYGKGAKGALNALKEQMWSQGASYILGSKPDLQRSTFFPKGACLVTLCIIHIVGWCATIPNSRHFIAKLVAHSFETEIFSDSIFHTDHKSDQIKLCADKLIRRLCFARLFHNSSSRVLLRIFWLRIFWYHEMLAWNSTMSKSILKVSSSWNGCRCKRTLFSY